MHGVILINTGKDLFKFPVCLSQRQIKQTGIEAAKVYCLEAWISFSLKKNSEGSELNNLNGNSERAMGYQCCW
jgi:hypothetical protein